MEEPFYNEFTRLNIDLDGMFMKRLEKLKDYFHSCENKRF